MALSSSEAEPQPLIIDPVTEALQVAGAGGPESVPGPAEEPSAGESAAGEGGCGAGGLEPPLHPSRHPLPRPLLPPARLCPDPGDWRCSHTCAEGRGGVVEGVGSPRVA